MLTGMQPSGSLHIGNYFGALQQAVALAQTHDAIVMVADLHALTSLKDASALRENILGVVKDYIGVGLNPAQSILFQQSQVQEHTELAWILECLVTVPFLMQSHAYKDKVAKGIEATAGLFNYPMLMAADILLYDTEVVPVGADQRQHVEYAREACTKFTSAFGDMFVQPQEYILESVALVPGTDGKKMSKSYGNTIPLFGSKDEIAKAVLSIVTDSSGERPENVYAIHTHFKSEAELETLYEQHKGKYKALKDALIDDVEAFVAPMRARRNAITDEEAVSILNEGSARARVRAQEKMKHVRRAVGIAL